MLEIYLAEGCPYCSKVRSYMESVGVDYVLKPVPLGGRTSPIKEKLRELGGKTQVPFLVDPEKSVQMFESSDIIDYVKENYVTSRTQ